MGGVGARGGGGAVGMMEEGEGMVGPALEGGAGRVGLGGVGTNGKLQVFKTNILTRKYGHVLKNRTKKCF